MTRDSFNQGRSVGEREGEPLYGAGDEAYSVSGDMTKYVGDIPEARDRNQPIRGNGFMVPIPNCHGARIEGTDVETSPTNRQVQGRVLEQMAANVSMAQYDYSHSIAVQRGMPGKADYPTSGPHIHASLQFGLGPNAAIAADLGHDPLDTQIEHDYRRSPEGPVPGSLDKYVGAAGVLAQPTGNASGFPRDHERSQFETMGETILNGLLGQPRKDR